MQEEMLKMIKCYWSKIRKCIIYNKWGENQEIEKNVKIQEAALPVLSVSFMVKLIFQFNILNKFSPLSPTLSYLKFLLELQNGYMLIVKFMEMYINNFIGNFLVISNFFCNGKHC